MEDMAISVFQRGGLVLRRRCVLVASAVRLTSGMTVVIVAVVAHMGQSGRLFVLAIRRCCNPDGLQREQHQQEDGGDAAHGRDLSGLRACM